MKKSKTFVAPVSPWRGLLLVVLVGLASHGLLLLTDYAIWDGIAYGRHLRMYPQNYDVFVQQWRDGGRLYDLLYFLPLRGLAHPELVAKWLGVASWILAAVGLYLFLYLIPELSRRLSLAITLVAVSLPFHDILGDLNALVSSVPVMKFWFAFALLQWSLSAKSASHRAVLLLMAAVLLFCSFPLASNLVLFYGVFGVWGALAVIRQRKLGKPTGPLLAYLPFLALPVGYWIAKRTFFPTGGFSKGFYNEPTFDMDRILSVYASAWEMFGGEFEQLTAVPLALVLCVVFAIAFLVWLSRSAPDHVPLNPSWRTESVALLLAGCLWTACAVFAYATVGQSLAAFGWWSRNAILMNVPVAFFLCGLFALLCGLLAPKFSRVFWLPVILVVLCGAVLNNANYLRFQALGAKQQAIVAAFQARLKNESNISVIQLRDYFIIPYTINYYPPSMWSQLIATEPNLPEVLVVDTAAYVPDQVEQTANGEMKRTVPTIDINRQALEMLIDGTMTDYLYENVPRDGRQLLAVIVPGSNGSDGVRLGLQYLWRKYFDAQLLPRFLASLLECRFQEIQPISN